MKIRFVYAGIDREITVDAETANKLATIGLKYKTLDIILSQEKKTPREKIAQLNAELDKYN